MLGKAKKFIILLLLPFIFVSTPCSAVTKDYNTFALHLQYATEGAQPETVFLGGYGVSHAVTPVEKLYVVGLAIGSVPVPTNSNYMAFTGKINLVAFNNNPNDSDLNLPYAYQNGMPSVTAVSINNVYMDFENSTTDVYETKWWCDPFNNGDWTQCMTFTYEVSFVVRNIPSTINRIGLNISYDTWLQSWVQYETSYYFEDTPSNRAYIDFSTDYNSALMQQQIQLQQININAINNLNETINNHYNQETEAIGNIDGQTTSDIPNSTNNQTTSLIGVISSFVTALSSVQTGSCELTLPFPNFAGGIQTVNPCSSKEKAPTLVAIGSSMFLIGVFIPFAFIVLKMIYNEIRSYTNG